MEYIHGSYKFPRTWLISPASLSPRARSPSRHRRRRTPSPPVARLPAAAPPPQPERIQTLQTSSRACLRIQRCLLPSARSMVWLRRSEGGCTFGGLSQAKQSSKEYEERGDQEEQEGPRWRPSVAHGARANERREQDAEEGEEARVLCQSSTASVECFSRSIFQKVPGLPDRREGCRLLATRR